MIEKGKQKTTKKRTKYQRGNFGLVWLVSLFNGISTLFRLFNAKAILLEEQQWYYLTRSWEDKGVHTFPKGICPKVNVIARLEYELAYYDSAVHRFNHYTTKTLPGNFGFHLDVNPGQSCQKKICPLVRPRIC